MIPRRARTRITTITHPAFEFTSTNYKLPAVSFYVSGSTFDQTASGFLGEDAEFHQTLVVIRPK